jgi:N-acetylglutamate synthase-like GNAT family acetyltransferase
MLTNIRKPEPQDLNYILDIDLKSFEDNWSYNTWRETLYDPRYGVLIGTYKGLPVGFVVWFGGTKEGLITRLGVKPVYQQKGVGTQLLDAVEVILSQQGIKEVHFPVTESLCTPGQPYDVSRWLTKRKYRASGLIRGSGIYCGVKEDEIIFQKFLEETSKHATEPRKSPDESKRFL